MASGKDKALVSFIKGKTGKAVASRLSGVHRSLVLLLNSSSHKNGIIP